jgi:hypothetical protein
MREWTRLIIDVDYHPCDPGNSNWYCERTGYPKSDLQAGKVLSYRDPGGLFEGIRVESVSEDGLVLSYAGRPCTINLSHPGRCLDKNGRDYTEFELNLSLELAIVVEDTPAFYRQFLTKDQVATLRDSDIRALEASDAPCARYALGRWHYLLVPREDSCAQAEKLFREAADADVADAFSALSTMYWFGDTSEARVDVDEMIRLRSEALARGSELAALRYARDRVDGEAAAPEEPAAVRDEVERILQADPDSVPEWYAVLGAAHKALGALDQAREAFEAGIAHGCVSCYKELARLALAQEDDKQFREWMEQGMAHGCAWCFLLDADMDNDAYEALSARGRYATSSRISNQLEQGLRLGEGMCGYYLGLHYLYGALGFEENEAEAERMLRRGAALGDKYSCLMLAELLESVEDASPEIRQEAARMRQKAYDYGAEEVLAEPEREEDDGRWDAYA